MLSLNPSNVACAQPQTAYGKDGLSCTLSRFLTPPQQILGSGQSGIVFQCLAVSSIVEIYAARMASYGRPLPDNGASLLNQPIAVKISLDAPGDSAGISAELAVNELLMRSGIPLLNVASPLCWMRLQPHPRNKTWIALSKLSEPQKKRLKPMFDGTETSNMSVIVAEYANAGTLFKQISELELVPRLNQLAFWRLYMLNAITQLFAQLACIRAVIPDFRHTDLHARNILCHKFSPGQNIIYRVADTDVALFVPLSSTNDCVLKITDFDLSDGAYQATHWPSQSSVRLRERYNLQWEPVPDHNQVFKLFYDLVIEQVPEVALHVNLAPDLMFIRDAKVLDLGATEFAFRRANFYHQLLIESSFFTPLRVSFSSIGADVLAVSSIVTIPLPASIQVQPLDTELSKVKQ